MESVLKISVSENDHHLGSLNSLVVLVEYGDFECPHSSILARVVEQLLTEFKSNFCFVFRHFPLSSIHPNSLLAARAAEAADQQHEFWSMWTFLFKNYDYLSEEIFDECAEGLELDIHQFKKDMKREDLLEKITKDFSGAVRSGVNRTPAIFLNGHRFTGQLSYDHLRKRIKELITEGELTYI